MQCGVQLTVWFNSANVMFNSSACNFPSCQACLVWLYIVQCGAQLMFGSFVVVFSKLFGSILQCNVQFLWVHSIIVYHVRSKSNLDVLNT